MIERAGIFLEYIGFFTKFWIKMIRYSTIFVYFLAIFMLLTSTNKKNLNVNSKQVDSTPPPPQGRLSHVALLITAGQKADPLGLVKYLEGNAARTTLKHDIIKNTVPM